MREPVILCFIVLKSISGSYDTLSGIIGSMMDTSFVSWITAFTPLMVLTVQFH